MTPEDALNWINLIGWPGFILFLFYKGVITWGKETAFWKERALRQMDKNEDLADSLVTVAERRLDGPPRTRRGGGG